MTMLLEDMMGNICAAWAGRKTPRDNIKEKGGKNQYSEFFIIETWMITNDIHALVTRAMNYKIH